MRLFKALIISLLVYALFVWLFMHYFSHPFKMPKLSKPHVIKIHIQDMPLPPKVKEKPVIKQPIIKTPKKKEITPPKVKEKKSVVKKRVVKKKKIIKKKKFIKKKKIVVKKRPPKKVIKREVPKEVFFEEEILQEESFVQERVEPVKSKELEAFEREMVYMDESMSILTKKVTTNKAPASIVPSWSYPNDKIRKLYGQSYQNFTSTQKEFIENNLDTIQQITQSTLTQRGYPEGAGRTGQEGTNVVSFNLHPNGDISDLRLKTRIGYRALDENTLSLIRVAYMDYPYPTTTTKIIFYVTYSIYGY